MKETVILHSPGPIAGLPGASHGPGVFEIDWDTRTITPQEVPESAPDHETHDYTTAPLPDVQEHE